MQQPVSPTLRELGYLDSAEVCELINVKKSTLDNWRANNTGPDYTRVHGMLIAYPIDGVRAWLKSRTVKAQKPSSMIDGRKTKRAKAAATVESNPISTSPVSV